MTNFGCCWWWWLLLGGLVGWLASWWLGRGAVVTVEKIVEKVVDRVGERPVERVVEKIVDRPVDRPVERIVEKLVDNPAHVSRIQTLEGEVALMAGLRAQISQLQADAAKPVERVPEPAVAPMIAPVAATVVAPFAPPMVEPAPPLSVPAPLRPVNKIMDRALERVVDLTAAGAAGYSVRGMDDLEIVEGIGPKIAALFKAEGIRMFSELAQTPQSRMQEILDKGGPSFRLAKPSSWARQAALAANNQWSQLRALQDELEGGVDKNQTGDL